MDSAPKTCIHEDCVVCFTGAECPICESRFRHLRAVVVDYTIEDVKASPDVRDAPLGYAQQSADIVMEINGDTLLIQKDRTKAFGDRKQWKIEEETKRDAS